MANIKKAILERIRFKVIKHQIGVLEKDLIYTYGQSNFKEVERISGRILELQNKQIGDMNSKQNQQLIEKERQLDEAFEVIGDLNRSLGLDLTPGEEKYVHTAMKTNPISQEEEIKAEQLLAQIMNQGGKII